MALRMLRDGIWSVGAVDWDRRLFDELIPLPEGTSYNSYLIKGREKTALLDTVDPTKQAVLFRHLRELQVDRIDYLVVHHGEQDHSGTIPGIMNLYPEARILCTPKCQEILQTHLAVPAARILAVPDRERVDLGGKTLEFLHAAWVHWPDTMFTYVAEERILFTCDFLGAHLATSDLYVTDQPALYRSAKRYYAEIMMPFRSSIRQHLDRIKELPVSVICPSHGPVHDQPRLIIDAYRDWISDRVANEVVLPFVSMHGSVQAMVEHFTDALIQRGIRVMPFNLTRTDIGELAMALVDAATIVIATPTVLTAAHPAAAFAAYLVNVLRPKAKFISLIGSYGWAGRMPETIKSLLANLKAVFLEPVVIRGFPGPEEYAALDRLAAEIQDQHRAVAACS